MIYFITQAWTLNPTLFLLTILTALTTLLLIVVVAKKSLHIKWGDKSFDIGNKENPQKCKECKLKVEEITKNRVKTVIGLRSDLVFRQIKYAQNALEKVSHKMLDEYSVFLKLFNGSIDIKADWSYVLYKLKLNGFIEIKLIKGLSQVYNENHIPEKSESEWVAHRNHIIETIHIDLLKYMDENFYPCYGMKREDLLKWHEDRWSYIADVVRDCLDNARIMSLKTAEEINEIKKINRIITTDY